MSILYHAAELILGVHSDVQINLMWAGIPSGTTAVQKLGCIQLALRHTSSCSGLVYYLQMTKFKPAE